MLRIDLDCEIIGKPEPVEWNMDGRSGKTFRLNIAQNDGRDMATLRCPEKVYNSVRRGDSVILACTFNDAIDRDPLRVSEVISFGNGFDNDLSGSSSSSAKSASASDSAKTASASASAAHK